MYSKEIQAKLARVEAWLAENALDGIVLSSRAHFAWITGGRDNHIVGASDLGVASILLTPGKLICLTNHIESPRFRTEELRDTGIDVVDYPWWDPEAGKSVVCELIAGRKVAADADLCGLSLPKLPKTFSELRWQLTDQEILHYRYCGQIAAATLESAAHQIQPGDSEFEIAARIRFEVGRTGAFPYVVLVAADDRILNYRHPIPTCKRLDRHAMLVSCAQYRGLICSCTRLVHFGKLPEDLQRRQQAIVNIDSWVNLATRPGRLISEVFADLQSAYSENGFADEWRNHHQGGSTGYVGRDVIGTPSAQVAVRHNQAFAWNPSICGTKSEDTMLVTDAGNELLTSPGDNWPVLFGQSPLGEMRRADVLIR